MVSKHEFETLANRDHKGRTLRKITRLSQFVPMVLEQLAGRSSLRDMVSKLCAQTTKLYHLGTPPVSQSSLARINEKQSPSLYEALFAKLLSQLPRACTASRHSL